MVMWLLSADVWFWQLPIHPHTDGLQSVNFSKMWHLTSAYMKCVYGWEYDTSSPNFLGWIVYQIFSPMVLRKRALRALESSAKNRYCQVTVHLPLASHAGVFRRARLSSLRTRDERRAPLKTPAWEANLPRDSVKFCVIFKDFVWATWGSDMKIVIEFVRKVPYSSEK